MGQQVNISSKVKSPSESDYTKIKTNYNIFIIWVMNKLLILDPK